MSLFNWLNKKIGLVIAVGIILLTGGVLVKERAVLVKWYYMRNLATADEKSRDVWIGRVADLGEQAVPDLLNYLTDPNPAVCANIQAVLSRMSKNWGINDARTLALARHGSRDFNRFSAAGQQNLLELAADWFRENKADASPGQGLLSACVRFLAEASSSKDTETQAKALDLCSVLLAQPRGSEALSAGRDLMRNCLSSTSAGNRACAVQLSTYAGMDLLEPVAALLGDPAVEVRRQAISAVGPAKDVVLDDALLPCLHDADPEVRQLCELALIWRERTPQQIRLGFLLTAPDPLVRIHVLEQLRKVPEVDSSVWVARISHDSSPAIRAAAARTMSELNMAERLEEMVRTDPSPTVSALAKYYLDNPNRRAGSDN